ncbi:unnamed protein product [Auanema sp. JU1783]|nr:unnamed protein product [Auanema sp. JU1783]
MGLSLSRINEVFGRRQEPAENGEEEPEEVNIPGPTGSIFGSHFLMCGESFGFAKPEAFLFGENADLELLGNRPVPFPYQSPVGSSEVRPLNLLVNIRKESVKFVRLKNESPESSLFQLEFTIDAECPCFVQVHFNAREFYQDGDVSFSYTNKKTSIDRPNHSERYHFDMGCDQLFNNYVFDLSKWDLSELQYRGGLHFPLVILVQTDAIERVQVQTTLCTIEPANDVGNMVILKALRQKIACDGVIYLLQEIFGIENKEQHADLGDEGGLECIICMSDVRDTVILPCRHLCICTNCADTLRYKLNNCPICRSPFRALIQLKAKRQTRNHGFETITLVEGLNGSQHVSYDRSYPGPQDETACSVSSIDDSKSNEPADVVESPDGIEMKSYPRKESKPKETPVLSNVSSRASTPSASVDEIDVTIQNKRHSSGISGRQSSTSLLESVNKTEHEEI